MEPFVRVAAHKEGRMLQNPITAEDEQEQYRQEYQDGHTLAEILCKCASDPMSRQNVVCDAGLCKQKGSKSCPGDAPRGFCDQFCLIEKPFPEIQETIISFLGADLRADS